MLWYGPLLCPFTLGGGAEARSGAEGVFSLRESLMEAPGLCPPVAGGLPACPAAAGTAHPPLGEGTAHPPLGEARAPGVGCPQGWNVPRGGLSPAFYRVASKCNSPPDRICQSKLGLGSSEPAYRCWEENPVFPKDKVGCIWDLFYMELVDL